MTSLDISSDLANDGGQALGWRSVDWPRQTRTAQLDTDRVSYVEFGGGESVVVLIHGLGGNWTAWLETIPPLAATHRVIALDLPGFGASPLPREPISIPGYARTVQRLMAHLGVDCAAVMGSSLGGWVAAELTLQAPQLVRQLVLVDAAGIVPTPSERRRSLSMMEMAAVMAPFAPRFRRSIASRRRLRAMALRYTTAKPAELGADLVFAALPSAPDPGFRPALRACKRAWSEAWCTSLRQIACPTLIVWGELDSLLPPRHGREYARNIPGSRLVVVPGAGHLPMLERPSLFNPLMSDFLGAAETAGSAGSHANLS